MRMTFVHAGTESPAIECLSAVLKQDGHQIHLAFDPQLLADAYIPIPRLGRFLSLEGEIVRQLEECQPHIVGFSVTTDSYRWALALASIIKERLALPTIFGGIHPTCLPESTLSNPEVDMVCVGEGEHVMTELANMWDDGRRLNDLPDIPGLWFKRDGQVVRTGVGRLADDLDSLPFADKQLFYDEMPVMKRHFNISTSRGCPHNCTFCCTPVVRDMYKDIGRYWRRRSTENSLAELVEAKEKWKYKSVSFLDDIFTIDKKWLREFLPLYKERIGLPYFCLVHPSTVDAETAQLLRDSGCVNVEVGVQTVNEELRSLVLRRRGANEQIATAIKALRSVGITVMTDFMVDLPGETDEMNLEAAAFFVESRPSIVNFLRLCYFPRTEIVDIGLDKGTLTPDRLKSIEQGNVSSIVAKGSSADPARYRGLEAFMSLTPFMPGWFARWILRKRLLKLFRAVPSVVSLLLPRFIAILFLKDLRSREHMRRILYSFRYVWRAKTARRKPARQ
jgi:radical SAM superfamily enzyme YgiQ (UPF0313 family)